MSPIKVKRWPAEKDIRYRQVFHGSPHDFERFDHTFMGTGEGAQAFGWGTYVTEVEGIGRKYAEIGKYQGEHIRYDGELLGDVLDNEYYFDDVWRFWKAHLLSSADVESLKRNIDSVYIDGRVAGPRSKRRKEFERQKKELLADIDAGRIKVDLPRHLYTVEIPDNTGCNYLQWAEPLSESIDKNKIAEALLVQVMAEKSDETEIEMLDRDIHDSFDEVHSGKELYKAIALFAGEQGASEFLSSVGFSGIEYPAEYTTGGRMDKARNYVIFNAADVQIIDHIRFRNMAEISATNINQAFREGEKAIEAQIFADKLRVPVRVVRNIKEIDDSERAAHHKREASGWCDHSIGEIAVVLPNCADAAEVQRTILHEAVAHYGLPELLGRERADELFRRVFASLDTATRRRLLTEYGSETVAGEEYLATMAEGNVTPGILRRIIAVVRDFFREVLDIDLKLTDADMQYMLWQSKHNLQRATGAVQERIEPGIRYRETGGIDHEVNDNSLIAVHNLSGERLKEAFELGGFPVPNDATVWRLQQRTQCSNTLEKLRRKTRVSQGNSNNTNRIVNKM